MDFQGFADWQAAKKGRLVEIKISDNIPEPRQEIEVWVFDHNFPSGQFVESVDEIDLEGKNREREITDLNRLLEKYPLGAE